MHEEALESSTSKNPIQSNHVVNFLIILIIITKLNYILIIFNYVK